MSEKGNYPTAPESVKRTAKSFEAGYTITFGQWRVQVRAGHGEVLALLATMSANRKAVAA